MTDMMQEMLTLNKARAGKLTFNPMLMDVEEFCRAVFDQVRMTSDSPRNFVFKVHAPVGSALIDEKLLQHTLLNLFSNAVKYSPEQGEIRFELWEQDSTLHFQISDQGMGIPESDQARLFEPFFRARNIGQIHGTGLGLAIVKESVTVHGGEIDFHSVEGQGTTFTVRLPKRTM
jgi:signal transduction histidine kinase